MSQVPVEPRRPSITPAQILAFVVAGVPVLANLLHVFGVFDLSREQQDALTSTMQWALGAGGVLAVADAVIRKSRNEAHATVASAAIHATTYAGPVTDGSERAQADFDPSGELGDGAPPEAALHPLTDPASIPPDEGDAEAEGTA